MSDFDSAFAVHAVTVCAELRSARHLVAHGPQLGKEPDVDALAEDLHRRALRADYAPADDPLDDLQMVESPDDGPLIPGHHLLGELIQVLELVPAVVDVEQRDATPRE